MSCSTCSIDSTIRADPFLALSLQAALEAKKAADEAAARKAEEQRR